MRSMKKILSMLMCCVFVGLLPMSAYASMNPVMEYGDLTYGSDPYEANYVEYITIEGVEYSYSYYYDSDNNPCIKMKNLDEDEVTEIKRDIEENTIYIDGYDSGIMLGEGMDIVDYNISLTADTGWIKVGSYTNRITWKQGTTAAVLAGVIAAVLSITSGNVLTSIGASALSIIAAACAGGTVYQTIYTRNLNTQLYTKVIWSFKPSTGEKYGPYTNIF